MVSHALRFLKFQKGYSGRWAHLHPHGRRRGRGGQRRAAHLHLLQVQSHVHVLIGGGGGGAPLMPNLLFVCAHQGLSVRCVCT